MQAGNYVSENSFRLRADHRFPPKKIDWEGSPPSSYLATALKGQGRKERENEY
jgi:hypothetical protein